MRVGTVLLVFSLFAFVVVGCSESRPKPPGFPELFRGTITITQEGRPLADASVVLHPEGETADWGTTGNTNSSGVVTLYTGSYWHGVPAGTYRVTVAKVEIEQSQLVQPPISDSEAYQAWEAAAARGLLRGRA